MNMMNFVRYLPTFANFIIMMSYCRHSFAIVIPLASCKSLSNLNKHSSALQPIPSKRFLNYDLAYAREIICLHAAVNNNDISDDETTATRNKNMIDMSIEELVDLANEEMENKRRQEKSLSYSKLKEKSKRKADTEYENYWKRQTDLTDKILQKERKIVKEYYAPSVKSVITSRNTSTDSNDYIKVSKLKQSLGNNNKKDIGKYSEIDSSVGRNVSTFEILLAGSILMITLLTAAGKVLSQYSQHLTSDL